jgi:hypothetical protein
MYKKEKRLTKVMVGVGLSLTIAFTGIVPLLPQPTHAAAATSDGVLGTAQQFLGVPYKFGAKSGRTDSFDCSSFTQFVFAQNGVHIPRSSRQQSGAGTFVPKNQLQAGDLVFSDTNRDGIINHVGIYMGNDRVIHTYRVGIGVTISKFSGSSWDRNYVTARRVMNGQAITAPISQPAYKPVSPISKKPKTQYHRVSKHSDEGENQHGNN